MRDDYDRDDRRERDERRPRRARHRDERESNTPDRPVSGLGVAAFTLGTFTLVGSLIPCVGAIAVPAALFTLILAIVSVLIARHSRQSMGFPVAATVVSGSALVASLLWLAMFGAMFRGADERATVRHAPSPPVLQAPTAPPLKATPQTKKVVEPKIDDEQFEKKLLEELAKDRIKEAIRNGPGVAVTAAKLEADYAANVVSAELAYKDKVLAVTGKVIRVVRDESKAVYTLELATDDPTKTVSCDFTEQTKHPLASVERGKSVTVRGLCVGRDNEFVKLKDCIVAK